MGDYGEVGHPEGEVDKTDLLPKAAQARVCRDGMVRATGRVEGFTHLSSWTRLDLSTIRGCPLMMSCKLGVS